MKTERWAIPASFFSMVLGLTGLGNDWRAAAKLWGMPLWIGELVMLLGVLVWATLLLLYGRKWCTSSAAARAEIEHPIQCCFVSLVPVSTMLVGMALLPHSRLLAWVLCSAGAFGALAFGVWRHGGLWRGGREASATTPVLYLPTVAANLVSAIAASALGWPEVGQLFLGAGILAWLALGSVILGRLLTAEELPPALRPTLGIQQAPPAVALLAYSSLSSGPPDLIAHMLLGYALVQSLIVLRLMPWIRQPFTPGYWAFTFGATALAAGVMRFAEREGAGVFAPLAPVLFAAGNLVVLGLLVWTLLAMLEGRLLPGRAAIVPGTTRDSR